ncbi:DNA-directed RNA polymerase sigma-70 factor [Acrocarpospora corrugata]|uniref:DNA-directed RNA polymerase sigma-70 factor n=1 Tax=Acrocarpospora corrugata TaxID=35763 RepID=A0A5M3W662_9ACTN|nr:sigma-70 family RNA polymerase sigma factor [Acrocarpospora corrugata]GES03789.1 DNA-directed RNA polymerase sigma-70 factor [Acrocarpospora corrugata]
MSEQVIRFTQMFDTCYESVLRYAARRVGKDIAGDIAGETFSIAWRRFPDLPQEDHNVLPWLYGVARNVIANEERRQRRSGRLTARLMNLSWSGRAVTGDHGEHVTGTMALEAVLSRLSPMDQEILRLIGWEDLPISQAAIVLKCSPAAAAVRARRARRRFVAALKDHGVAITHSAALTNRSTWEEKGHV